MPAADLSGILTIPEIQNSLACHLEYSDLENCQSVCRTWRYVFSPCVWQKRPLTLLGPIRHHLDPESLEMLQHYGQHVRHLTIQRVYMLRTMAPYLTNISSLTVRQQLAADAGALVRWCELVTFMDSCARLDTLTIYTASNSHLSHFVPALSRAVGNRLRQLTIHMDQRQEGRSSDLVGILIGLPSLVSLQVFSGSQEWQIDHEKSILQGHRFKLRILEIFDIHGRQISHQDILALIQSIMRAVRG